jgi:oligosaccharide repeat unit polymerase
LKDTILKILFVIALSCGVILFDDYKNLGEFYFYFLIIFLAYDIIINRRVSLLTVWNSGFLFIILSEVFSTQFELSSNKISALKFLIIANNFILIGYFSKIKRSLFTLKALTKREVRINRFTPIILMGLVTLYFALSFKSAVQLYSIGRIGVNYASEGESSYVFSSIVSSLGYVLPALIAYYYIIIKESKIIIPLLISSPIFLLLFLGGTRFPLLFSFIGFILVAQSRVFQKMTLKKYIILFSSFAILFLSTIVMKQVRAAGNTNDKITIFQGSDNMTLPSLFALNASPEGVIDMTDLMLKHFETNDFKYGASSSFIFYFWVPRTIWPDKPTMLGHWLIRDYRSGFSSGHSSSFGFTGELYSDYGLFSLLFVFFIGRLLKFAEEFKNWALKSNNYVTVLGAMMFPYVFFFVRSPITASMNFLGILFFYFLIKKLIFQYKH